MLKHLAKQPFFIILFFCGIFFITISSFDLKNILGNDFDTVARGDFMIPFFVLGCILTLFSLTLFIILNLSDIRFNLHNIKIETLCSRIDLFERAAEIIKKSNKIFDTTWGKIPSENLLDKEKEALRKYQLAKKDAITRGAEYKELFSNLEMRKERIDEAKEMSKDKYKYQITNIFNDIPIIDFLVADEKYILISHKSSKTLQDVCKYLYIESTSMGKLFTAWFEEAWRDAEKASTSKPT